MSILRGQIIGKEKLGVPNIRVELYESDDHGNPTGSPLLTAFSRVGGFFRLDLARLPPAIALPSNACLVFRDRIAEESKHVGIPPEAFDGEKILFEDPTFSAPKTIQIWPNGYQSIKQMPDEVSDKKRLGPQENLPLEGTPEISYFTTYSHVPPLPEYWPWEVGASEIDGDNPFDEDYLVGFEITHLQRWEIQGQGRGELLHSLPLAPGEETNIEILTWDRHVFKREEEFRSDLEREVERNRQFKDSREVLREMENLKKWKVGGGLSLDLKIVTFEFGGDVSEEARALDKSVRETVVETTDRAVSKVRNEHKTSISTTRELGRETKVTRKIANTNRCHAVTYNFYEVLRGYDLTTFMSSVRPCIFVKLQTPLIQFDGADRRPISREDLLVDPSDDEPFLASMRWLHVNSHVLARGLLDRSLYAGLQALEELIPYWRVLADGDLILEGPVRTLVEQIEAVWEPSNSVEMLIKEIIDKPENEALWIWELILNAPNSLKNTLPQIGQGRLKAAVARFITRWNDLETGYLHIDENDRGILETPVTYAPYLVEPVAVVRNRYDEVSGSEIPEEVARAAENQMRNLSEVVRLMRHIERHFLHYCQLIWADQDADERLLDFSTKILPGDGYQYRLSDVIENDLLGLYAHYAVFPLKPKYIVESSQFAEAFLRLQTLAENPVEEESQAVLPSNGIIVEPHLEQKNSACEQFIQRHRTHDLDLKAAEVRQAELENQRRERKIDVCELENPKCCPSPKYGFLHRLICKLTGKEG